MKSKYCLFLVIFLICSTHCFAELKIKGEFLVLITGCGRSGTTYIADVLSLGGVPIGHEHMNKYGTADWFMASKKLENYRLGTRQYLKFKHIFHQVRNPLDTISSWYYNKMKRWDYVYEQVPEIKPEEPLLVRCAKYWYYWNLKAEEKAEWRYRVEDIGKVFDEMMQRLGLNIDKSVLSKVPKDTNQRVSISKNVKITWADLRRELSDEDYNNIKNMAIRYGYSVIDKTTK